MQGSKFYHPSWEMEIEAHYCPKRTNGAPKDKMHLPNACTKAQKFSILPDFKDFHEKELQKSMDEFTSDVDPAHD